MQIKLPTKKIEWRKYAVSVLLGGCVFISDYCTKTSAAGSDFDHTGPRGMLGVNSAFFVVFRAAKTACDVMDHVISCLVQ